MPQLPYKLAANTKFCPECGNKIEVKKPAFCTSAVPPLTQDLNFVRVAVPKLISGISFGARLSVREVKWMYKLALFY